MGIFKKLSSAKTAVTAPQTYRSNPFGSLENYVPLLTPQTSLYRELREAVPVLDAAIYKIIRLTGGFRDLSARVFIINKQLTVNNDCSRDAVLFRIPTDCRNGAAVDGDCAVDTGI